MLLKLNFSIYIKNLGRTILHEILNSNADEKMIMNIKCNKFYLVLGSKLEPGTTARARSSSAT
jgi:hypothetical protein